MLLTARRDTVARGVLQNLPANTAARLDTALAYLPPLVELAETPLAPGKLVPDGSPVGSSVPAAHSAGTGLGRDSNTSTLT